MTDNGDGTYYFDYSVPLDGAVTIVVQLLTVGNVYGEWFANTDCSGSPGLTNYTSNINFYWSSGTNIVLSQSTLVSGKIYAKLKPTISNLYTLYFIYDDGSKIVFDGTTKINHFGSDCHCDGSFAMSLIGGQYYDIEIFFYQNTSEARVILEWSSSTISRQVIPSSYYSSPTNVLASPLQVSVDCLSGYTGSNPSSLTTCKEICGDGIKVGSEQCDDGNTINGDGCSSTCKIETSSACSGGSSTTKDTCQICSNGFYQNDVTNPTTCVTKCGDGIRAGNEACDDGNRIDGDGCASDCLSIENGWVCNSFIKIKHDVCIRCDVGYISNENWTECVDGNIPRDSKMITLFTLIAISLGVSSNLLISALTSATSPQSKFGLINQIQLLLILPLINCYYPEKVMDFIKAMKSSLFSLSFLPIDQSETITDFKNMFKTAQYNSYMYLLDLKSGSAFINVLNLSIVVGCVICLHLPNGLLDETVFKKLLMFTISSLTFGFYIGVYLQTFLLICFVDFNEILTYQKSGFKNDKSIVMAFVIAFLILCFILLALWQWLKSRNPAKFEKQKYFLDLIQEMKPKWICRSFNFVFLVRRTLFCVTVYFLGSFTLTNRLIVYVSIQGIYFLYIIILRPHKDVSSNLIDFVNELLYCYYCSFLFFYNTEKDWTDTVTDIYFWILVSNNFVVILISFVASIKSFIEIFRKWSNKKQITSKNKENEVVKFDYKNKSSEDEVSKKPNQNEEDISASPVNLQKPPSYISFIPSTENNNNFKIRGNFQPRNVKHYQREMYNFREESRDEYQQNARENNNFEIYRLERKQEAKNNKFKHEELKVSKFDFVKENSKKLGKRINQDVDFEF